MFKNDKINVELYDSLMVALKKENENYHKLKQSKEYRLGHMLCNGKKRIIPVVKNKLFRKSKGGKAEADVQEDKVENIKPNYYSNERIAIYTAIYGKYDELLEPAFLPDNCDFFVLTDQVVDKSSYWNQIEFKDFPTEVQTNIEKNRFCKMFPYKVNEIESYKYSVYIDGNMQAITDLTELVNRIGAKGIACHKHSVRNCAYDEAEACIKKKKDTKENIVRHVTHLQEASFPRNYGLCECNVIVRDHTSEIMKRVMEDWWKEFMVYCKRDQISFPYVLFTNNIMVEDVATLGENVHKNYALRRVEHMR